MAAMQLPAARGVADTLFSVLPRAAELVVWDLLRVALSPILGFGGSKAEPGPDVPVMRWYQEAVLDPDSLQARAGRPVGFKGVGRNQHLNRRLYVAAGRGDAGAVRKLAKSGADVNARLFQLINYLDGSNGQPSGHGVRLSEFRGRWIDQRPDWNVARWGRAGDPAAMTYASRTALHEAAKRGCAATVAALLELGASPYSRGEGLRTPAQEAPSRAGDFAASRAMLAAAAGGAACEAGEAGAADAAAEDVDALRAENARLRVEAAVLRAELDSRGGGAIQ
ncbi:hypothetical protein JL721_5032 [Aureococcus anophagefferens]|nr:hypothetical protein JL721_5032 [Aureococcus anophagefferens]